MNYTVDGLDDPFVQADNSTSYNLTAHRWQTSRRYWDFGDYNITVNVSNFVRCDFVSVLLRKITITSLYSSYFGFVQLQVLDDGVGC